MPASALTIDVQGDCIAGHELTISAKDAFIVIRLNDGTPIYAYNSTVFTPAVSGKLYIEAIAGGEKAVKTVEIKSSGNGGGQTGGGGGGGYIGDYYLPSRSTTITLEDGGSADVNYRTALGALLKASSVKGFGIKIKSWSYGLFVDCIGGICTKAMGSTSGWMYTVNGETPMVSAEQYTLRAGDTVTWYFSRSMSDKPNDAPFKVTIKTYSDWSFDVSISPAMPWKLEESSETNLEGGEVKEVAVVNETVKQIVVTVSRNSSIEIPGNISKVPMTINVTTLNEEVTFKIADARPRGGLHGYILDCLEIKPDRPVKATIHFTVPKEIISKYNATLQDVYLAKFNKTWTYLPTSFTGENETDYFYETNVTNFSFFAVVIKWKDFPLNHYNKSIVKALSWLKEVQGDDGGFGSISNTSWVIMALVSAGENPYNWTKNGKNPVDYLRANLNETAITRMGTSDLERTIITLVATGQDPKNFGGIDFIAKLKSKVKSDGQIGDFIYTTIWGIIALKACGENVTKSVEWLKAHQNEDGGFAWAVGEQSDYDDTAAAIQALIAAGEPIDSEKHPKSARLPEDGAERRWWF
jgi:PGF-pre-PGF domain-containing protein